MTTSEIFPAERAKIAVGIGTIAGLLGGLAGVIAPFIAELSDAGEPLGIDPKIWLITGAALTFTTIVGRMGQAMAAILKANSGDTVAIPADQGDVFANVGPDGAPLV